jgi:GNAT superfamily N-acetyltransferase
VRIRTATVEDVEEIIEMGRGFYDESPFASISTFDEGSLRLTILALINGSMQGGLLVAEADRLVGMAAYVIFPLYFNMQTKIGQEVFWWVRPEHRRGVGSRLMDELEAEAKRNGAKVFIGANLSGEHDAAFARLYRRRGYMPGEQTHIRILSS